MSDTGYRIEWYQIYTGVKDLSVIDKGLTRQGYQRIDFRPVRIGESYLCMSLEVTVAASNHVAISPQEPRFILAPLAKPKRITLVEVLPTPPIAIAMDFYRRKNGVMNQTPSGGFSTEAMEIFRVESES